jgi:hypothetical protein
MTEGQITLRPTTLEEQLALEAYQEAIKGALSSADSAADKILTAALSVSTLYGALVTLVKPETEAAPIVLAIPFALLALAAVISGWALTAGVSNLESAKVESVKKAVRDTISAKRLRSNAAVLLMAIALVAAGVVVTYAYG